MEVINREEAIKKLQEQQKNHDLERAHGDADDILCALLNSLGYEDVVQAWEEIHKWYA